MQRLCYQNRCRWLPWAVRGRSLDPEFGALGTGSRSPGRKPHCETPWRPRRGNRGRATAATEQSLSLMPMMMVMVVVVMWVMEITMGCHQLRSTMLRRQPPRRTASAATWRASDQSKKKSKPKTSSSSRAVIPRPLHATRFK